MFRVHPSRLYPPGILRCMCAIVARDSGHARSGSVKGCAAMDRLTAHSYYFHRTHVHNMFTIPNPCLLLRCNSTSSRLYLLTLRGVLHVRERTTVVPSRGNGPKAGRARVAARYRPWRHHRPSAKGR
eukprot:7389101-Prymnesium_polylepis.1